MRNICITRSGLLTLVFTVTCAFCTVAQAQSIAANSEAGTAAVEPYPNMPAIPPIGVRTGKYFDVPASAKGPAVDPAKGYRLQDFGNGLYMITDNQIQSMFLVYERGVVIMDAPQAYAAHIRQAVAEVTDKPITHLIYSHFHADHIGGAKTLGDVPVIIAHEETLRLLKRDADPKPESERVLTVAYKIAAALRQQIAEYRARPNGAANEIDDPGYDENREHDRQQKQQARQERTNHARAPETGNPV